MKINLHGNVDQNINIYKIENIYKKLTKNKYTSNQSRFKRCGWVWKVRNNKK